ncbi:MAG TPA: glycosyltransferase [Kiritimatiellia bacterium]|nr:glycosyltransferase [Kiritimatiellia bacterium]
MSAKPRIAFWFRYGAAEHTELYHALPRLLEALSAHAEVHYFGFEGRRPAPESITRHAVLHRLPFRVDRTKHRDKLLKYVLWLLCLPWIGLRCRALGIRAVYIDETVPLAAPLARVFFGRNVAITIADFFTDIYLPGGGMNRLFARAIQALDWAAWRKLPLIVTRAKNTRDFLASRGVDPARVHPIYDPVDAALYHPADRAAARAYFGYGDDEVVLVHHGILHPNKGNDRILRALAAARHDLPNVRYLLVGNGPEFERLQALARELRIDDIVRMTGWLPKPEDVNIALNAGDIGLVMRVGHASDDFHMTGALVHNMAAGLPILAAKLAGVSEVVEDGVQGQLFPPDDMALFTRHLARLAGDADLRRRMGAAALEQARRNFDVDHVVAQTVYALLTLVKP